MLTNMFMKLAMVGAEWVMWLLLGLSFASIGIIVDRWLYFWKHHEENEKLSTRLPELFRSGDVKSVWEMVSGSETLAGMVVATGLQSIRRGADACSEAMQSVKLQSKGELDARLSMLGTIGSNAPFIGLMGTVLGVIKAAHDLSSGAGGTADPNAVMAGVFEALIATAVGLLVAIPAVIAFNYFQRKVRTALTEVDALAHLVLAAAHSSPQRRPSSPTTAPEPARAI